MAVKRLDKERRKALQEAQKMIEDVQRMDGNESETRRRIERMFDSVMGYDVFKHITREHAVHGYSETEYCDFVIQLEDGDGMKPTVFIEIKRISIDLAAKHLKQVVSYAINAGAEWVVLTNGRDWKLYHITFGQPPETKLIESWNLLNDDLETLDQKFYLLHYKNVRRGGLDKLWEKRSVLTPRMLLSSIFSEDCLMLIRRQLRKETDVLVPPEDVIRAVRRLLNENASKELEGIKITLPERKTRRRRKSKEGSDSPTMTVVSGGMAVTEGDDEG